MKKTKLKINKPIYLGFSILDLSKIVMHEFWYDYIKPKYGRKSKIVLHGHSVIICIKPKDFYKDIADDVEKRFDKSNSIEDRPLPIGKIRKLLVL